MTHSLALWNREIVGVAVVGNRDAANQFHHEVWPAGASGTGVEHRGDVWVIHEGNAQCAMRDALSDWFSGRSWV